MTSLLIALALAANPITNAPAISPAGGDYTGSISVTVSAKGMSSGSIIRCTQDGSDPSILSPRYLAPITLTCPTVVKCRSWSRYKRSSAVATASYQLPDTVTQVTVSPPTATVQINGTQQFTATVYSLCFPGGQSSAMKWNGAEFQMLPAIWQRDAPTPFDDPVFASVWRP